MAPHFVIWTALGPSNCGLYPNCGGERRSHDRLSRSADDHSPWLASGVASATSST